MGSYKYQPDTIKESELDTMLEETRTQGIKVDHYIVRTLLNDVIGELNNEVRNIEDGHRDLDSK